MKHVFILSAFFALIMIGCNSPETSDSKIIIAGKLDNTDIEEINIYLEEEIAKATVMEDGSFQAVFESESAENYNVRIGREGGFTLFLNPGDSIFMEGDANELYESLKFHGDKVAENTYQLERDILYRESGIGNMMELMGLEKSAYFSKRDEYFVILRSKFDDLKLLKDINKEFLKLEEAYIEYQPMLMDSQYPMYNAYINKIAIDSVDFPTAEIKGRIATLDLTRVDLLNSGSYKALINARVSEEVSEILKQDSTLNGTQEGYEAARFMAMDIVLLNQEVKDQFLFDYIKSNLEYRGPVHVKTSYDKFISENQSPKLKVKLEEIKDKWNPIMPGKEVPDFSFVNTEGDEVKMSDLKGTLVYIDIWATWCGPCIAEHPHWDKMKEEYKDEEISFLTVSIDDDKEPWIKMVDDKKMAGLQWFAADAWKSEFAQHFMVNAIPRFLLLDKEGKIIDPSADRPSGKIREMVEKHL